MASFRNAGSSEVLAALVGGEPFQCPIGDDFDGAVGYFDEPPLDATRLLLSSLVTDANDSGEVV
jgi:hypothetical protein